MIKRNKIVVGLSGGVDSTIAAYLLKKQGWAPLGVGIKISRWQNENFFEKDNSAALKTARDFCHKFKIPFYTIDGRKDFEDKVVNYFIQEYKKGRTPNPCVICNRYFKFKKLFEFAEKEGIEYVATGHYAQIKFNPQTKKYELWRAKDKNKDQSYYLCLLPQKWLKRIIFPLGNLTKKEVKQLAIKIGLDVRLKNKRGSQDFCYLNKQPLSLFLKNQLGCKKGIIIDSQGRKIGEHSGAFLYTIGQRKGLTLSNGPYFVKAIDVRRNIVQVTKNKKELFQKEMSLYHFYFISQNLPSKKLKVRVKIRYKHPLVRATLHPPRKNKLKVVFEKSQRAVTPGQFCVFYQGNLCLGGGIILK